MHQPVHQIIAAPQPPKQGVVSASSRDLSDTSLVRLPQLATTPRQDLTVVPIQNSPRRQLGDKVVDAQSTVVQRRLKMIESKVCSSQVNPIAAWPSTGTTGPRSSHCLTTRPPLSVELENYIRKEHRNLLMAKPDAGKRESLPIYREAFGCIINHFPEYASIFSIIKSEYDQAVSELESTAQRVAKIELENNSMKATHLLQLQQEREQLHTCLSEAQAQLAAALRANQTHRQHIAKLEYDRSMMQQSLDTQKREFDESQERVRVLSVTLVEEASRMSKLMANYHTAQRETERLNLLVESLRQIIAEAERTIQVFRQAPMGNETDDGAKTAPQQSFRKGPRLGPAAATKKGGGGGGSPRGIDADDTPPLPTISTTAKVAQLPRRNSQFSPNNTLTESTGGRASSIGGGFTNEEVETLREQIFDLECKTESLEHKLSLQTKENTKLLEKLDRVQQHHGRDTLTPRPDWGNVSARLPGFERDPSRSSVESAADLVTFMKERLHGELLANERKGFGEIIWNWLNDDDICEADLLHRYKYFVPRGTAPSVPVYLR